MEISCAWCGHTLVMESYDVKEADNKRTYISILYKCHFEKCPCENKTYVRVSDYLSGNDKATKFTMTKI